MFLSIYPIVSHLSDQKPEVEIGQKVAEGGIREYFTRAKETKSYRLKERGTSNGKTKED